MNLISSILSWIDGHQAILIPVAVLVLTDLANGLMKYTGPDAGLARTIVGIFLDLLSHHQNSNSPGTLKLPFTRSNPPVDMDMEKTPNQRAGYVRIETVQLLLALCCLGLVLAGCAGVSFETPVFYAGPTVAPIEVVALKKGAQPAATAGFQATVGLGQFELAEKEWDALDVSALALGGLVASSGTPGLLQTGVEIGTLNGIVGVGLLVTPYTADNQGFFQGGGPGWAVAGMLNIQALVSYFGSTTSVQGPRLMPRLPRGGL